MIAALGEHRGWRIVQQLRLVNGRDWNYLVESLRGGTIHILAQVVLPIFNVSICLVKEILLSS